MRIAILSDIHDNIWALHDVLAKLQVCDALLCLGDLCSPFTLTAICEGFAKPVHVIWGNNDGDKLLIARNADRAGNATLHGDFAELEFGGRRVCLTHYPHIGQALALGGRYDLVCHGHDHHSKLAWIGKSLLLDPGEVMGRFGARSWAVYDTDTAQADILELAPS